MSVGLKFWLQQQFEENFFILILTPLHSSNLSVTLWVINISSLEKLEWNWAKQQDQIYNTMAEMQKNQGVASPDLKLAEFFWSGFERAVYKQMPANDLKQQFKEKGSQSPTQWLIKSCRKWEIPWSCWRWFYIWLNHVMYFMILIMIQHVLLFSCCRCTRFLWLFLFSWYIKP